MIVQGDDKRKALALEGRFILNYEQSGLQDTEEDKLVYVETGEKDPYRDLHVILKSVAVFVCIWDRPTNELHDLAGCRRRLIAEPIKKLNYYQKETGVMNDGICTQISNYVADVRSLVASVECAEVVYLVSVLGSQARHLSLGYYADMREYFKEVLVKFKGSAEEYECKECVHLTEALEEFWRLFKFHQNENAKLEELRQEQLKLNNAKADNVKHLYKKATIFECRYIYEYKVEEHIKVMLISRLKGILTPLLLFSLSNCLASSSMQEDKSYTWTVLGVFSADYFNKVLTAWEPLVEPFEFQSESQAKAGNEIVNILIPKCVNVNITEEQIETLHSYWRLLNTEAPDTMNYFNAPPTTYTPKHSLMKIAYETGTDYAINNQSGETIYVSVLGQQRIAIPPSQQISVCTLPSEEAKSSSLLHPVPFKAKIEFDPKLQIEPLEWPELSCEGSFACTRGRDNYQFADKIVDHQKVLTIATSYQLANELEVPLVVTFYPPKGAPRRHVLCERTITLSIPVALVEVPGILSLRNLHKREGPEFTFMELRERLAKAKFVKMTLEEGYNAILELKEENGVVNISVWPHLCVYNCLPVPLAVKFMETNVSISLKAARNHFVHNCIVPHEGRLEISIPNFKAQQISYNLVKRENTVVLVDKSMHEICLKMKILVNRKALYSIVFYADYVVENLTQDNLIFYATTKVKDAFKG